MTPKLFNYIEDLKNIRLDIAESDSKDYLLNRANHLQYNLVMFDQVKHANVFPLIANMHGKLTELIASGALHKDSFLALLDNYINDLQQASNNEI